MAGLSRLEKGASAEVGKTVPWAFTIKSRTPLEYVLPFDWQKGKRKLNARSKRHQDEAFPGNDEITITIPSTVVGVL